MPWIINADGLVLERRPSAIRSPLGLVRKGRHGWEAKRSDGTFAGTFRSRTAAARCLWRMRHPGGWR